MDANELKEWNKIRSRELKEKFLKSQKILGLTDILVTC